MCHEANNRVYLHWKYLPTWKIQHIRFNNCKSLQNLLNSRIARSRAIKIKHKFTQINGYPKWVFNKECNLCDNLSINTNNKVTTVTQPIQHTYLFDHVKVKGQRIIKSINKSVKKILPENHVTQNVYKSKKLGSQFNIKILQNQNISVTLPI